MQYGSGFNRDSLQPPPKNPASALESSLSLTTEERQLAVWALDALVAREYDHHEFTDDELAAAQDLSIRFRRNE